MQKARSKSESGSNPICPGLPYDLVMVEWVDANRLSDGWLDLAAVPGPNAYRGVTVGFRVSETNGVPTIGGTEHRNNSHTYGGMKVPASARC